MKKDDIKVDSRGVGVLGLLGVAFVVLKLCGVINWSWWWVTSPFWAVPAIFLLVILGVLVVVGTTDLFKLIKRR
ncbi:hypothetical protein D1872_51180 [compost metagenome]